jgi:hypothetical protein
MNAAVPVKRFIDRIRIGPYRAPLASGGSSPRMTPSFALRLSRPRLEVCPDQCAEKD